MGLSLVFLLAYHLYLRIQLIFQNALAAIQFTCLNNNIVLVQNVNYFDKKKQIGAPTKLVKRDSSGKQITLNSKFHQRLQKYFPDWKRRIDYQKTKEDSYKSAMKKTRFNQT